MSKLACAAFCLQLQAELHAFSVRKHMEYTTARLVGYVLFVRFSHGVVTNT